ncbi:VOC family protein [Tabrizicola sp.]|uniref:VOC family protein n=1 Tax=Tabrizicola sp. TaxID=2005166 RepID=UPI002736A9C8|nr:VOC family protein [Tabrizicola sp.]MDP3197799.1 VOC family protein [Tabrizicola sp.]
MLRLDHLAVSAATLEDGAAWVEMALGVPLAGGGKHPQMGTHNRLLSLGDLYLEVIATDPASARPAHPRWFDLDHFQGAARLTNWICRTDDLDAALAKAPSGTGAATDLARGDYRWRFAVPDTGKLPFDNCFPALIQWQGDLHPARTLRDHGIRLARLEITHPDAPALQNALTSLADPRLHIQLGPYRSLRATFDTPHGPRVLT